MLRKRLGQRGRRGNRIPGADRGPTIDRAERRSIVAFHIDPVAYRVGAGDLQTQRLQVLAHIVAAHMQGCHIGGDQAFFASELLSQQGLNDLQFNA